MHLSYDVNPRPWLSADANFWCGGATSLNGLENANTSQKKSRVGATASIPLNKRQSFKFSCSASVYIRFGGNYQKVPAARHYSSGSRAQIVEGLAA